MITSSRSRGERPPHVLTSEEYPPKVMPAILTSWDLITLYVLLIFFPTNVSNAIAGGAAGITFWLVGAILFFVPCAIVTAQLSVIFPHEGSLYNWAYRTFGSYMSFFVGFCVWLPAPLLLMATSDLAISYIPGLNSGWLTAPWQQGLALSVVILISGFMAVQPHRTVQNITNATFVLLMIASGLVVLAGIVWLLTGHAPATSFSRLSDWLISWDPKTGGNFGLFGVITLGYLGVYLPITMQAETIASSAETRRHLITRHLLWGTLIVVVSYVLVTFAVLVVEGPKSAYVLFALVSTVDSALGKLAGNVVAVCMLGVFCLVTMVYNHIYARFLMVAGFDRRIPVGLGLLNTNRQPARAVAIQTAAAIFITILFFMVIPYMFGSNPADLSLEVYFVGIGAGTILWAFSTIFLFILILGLYIRDRRALLLNRLVPIPVLLLSAVVGLITGIVAIIDTALNSWVPLLTNQQWSLIVTGLTAATLMIGAIISMFATGEAAWQEIERGA
ncbi:APC family permease [Thermogemmatispora carboxidivorans]|uniref:APC family permease n=1 Tax=Thermogemmatispora carboxidivorans TaxID=1382306 RepID=UPI0009DF6835|nr:APC family permease [Thermogemmatispora carboxidivorans]